MIFAVSYSQEKDIWNHLNSNWHFNFPQYGRKGIRDKLLKSYPKKYRNCLSQAKTETEAIIVIKKFLNSLPEDFHSETEIIAKNLDVFLNANRKVIIAPLEKIYSRPFP